MKTRFKYRYCSIATLGNQLTCSFFALAQYCKKTTIKTFESFEDAVKAVKEGVVQAVFIPAAYPHLRTFLMDESLCVKETVIVQIPALVLAGKFLNQPAEINRIYLHPAPESLLPESGTKYEEKIFVSSNPNACIEVLANASNSIAITNENCAQYYELVTYKILRAGIFMPFVLFVHA